MTKNPEFGWIYTLYTEIYFTIAIHKWNVCKKIYTDFLHLCSSMSIDVPLRYAIVQVPIFATTKKATTDVEQKKLFVLWKYSLVFPSSIVSFRQRIEGEQNATNYKFCAMYHCAQTESKSFQSDNWQRIPLSLVFQVNVVSRRWRKRRNQK